MASVPGGGGSFPPNLPTPGPLTVIQQYPDTTLDLMYNIILSLNGTSADIEQKYYDTGDDLLYAILKLLHGGGFLPPSVETSRLLMGNVTWSGTGLLFDVTECFYYILGQMLHSDAVQIELDPADPDNPRIDVFYVDADGNVGVAKGEPAASPLKPVLEFDTQLELSFVLVNAGALTPANIVNENVYQEHVEWDCFRNNVDDLSFDKTNAPQSGAKHIGVADFGNDFFYFTKESILSANTYQYLRFYMRIDALREFENAEGGPFKVCFMNGTDIVSSIVNISDGLYGISYANEGWQLVTIPLSRFSFSTTNFNRIKFQFGGGRVSAFSLDNIVLQRQLQTDACECNILISQLGNRYRLEVFEDEEGNGILQTTKL